MCQAESSKGAEITITTDDLPDEADLAQIQVNQNVVLRLRERERNLIAKIESALNRIDEGIFGYCMDCEEPIESRRLEARPVSSLCLSCKEREEHRERIFAFS